jgi:hypothetical protein
MQTQRYTIADALLLTVLGTVIRAMNPVRPILFKAAEDQEGWWVTGKEEPFDFYISQHDQDIHYERQGYWKDGRKSGARREEGYATTCQDYEEPLARFLTAPWASGNPSKPALTRLDTLGPADKLLIEVLNHLMDPVLRKCAVPSFIRYPGSPTTPWVLNARRGIIEIEISLQERQLAVTWKQNGPLDRGQPAIPTAREDRRVGTDSPDRMQKLTAIVAGLFP